MTKPLFIHSKIQCVGNGLLDTSRFGFVSVPDEISPVRVPRCPSLKFSDKHDFAITPPYLPTSSQHFVRFTRGQIFSTSGPDCPPVEPHSTMAEVSCGEIPFAERIPGGFHGTMPHLQLALAPHASSCTRSFHGFCRPTKTTAILFHEGGVSQLNDLGNPEAYRDLKISWRAGNSLLQTDLGTC